MKKQKRSITSEYIYANRIRLITAIICVTAGVLAGCGVFLFSNSSDEIYARLSQMINSLTGACAKEVFFEALKENALVCAVFYIFSLFAIGEFLSFGYVVVRCVAYGFCACLVMRAYGSGGILLTALGLMPQMILYICGLVIFSIETSKQCRFIGGCFDKNLRRRSFVTYFAVSLLPALLLFGGCLVEGFAAPHIILWCLKKI